MSINLFLSALVVCIGIVQAGQLESPCPGLLSYEPRNPDEPDTWHAGLTLNSPHELEGLWIRIVLDSKAELLQNSNSSDVNWFNSEVRARDDTNTTYLISNRSFTLEADSPILIKFLVKYDTTTGIVPSVSRILLNAYQICPHKESPLPKPVECPCNQPCINSTKE